MKVYSPAEEKINVVSHTIGFVMSVIGLVLLVIHASLHGDTWHIVSASIFGASLMTLYAASTLYHNAKDPKVRFKLKVFDHASVFVLIAGSYTPFTLVTLRGPVGWWVFGIIWGLALAGIVLKLFFTGKYNIILTLMYVLMGWVIIFAIKPLVANLPPAGLPWLVAGGISYTVGALLYSIKKIPGNHAVFHLLVLVGSLCHFVTVYVYVLPHG